MRIETQQVVKTKCKFIVSNVVTDPQFPGQEQISAYATYGKGPEDNPYSTYTPIGNFNFTVTNPAIVGKIKGGDIFMIDIDVLRNIYSEDVPEGVIGVVQDY